MADEYPFYAAETGTYSTASPNPHVNLSGTAASFGTYPVRTFAQAAADTTTIFDSGNTCSVVVWKDGSNYKRYEGATWTDASPDIIDLSAATLVGSEGTLSNNDTVTVVATEHKRFRQHVYIDASAIVPYTTSGAAPGKKETTTNKLSYDYLAFDGASSESALFKLAMPDDWDLGTIKAKIFWEPDTGASAGNGVVWGIAGQAISNDDAIDNAFGSNITVADTVLAVGDEHVTAATGAITIAGTPSAGDMIYIKVVRLPADASDTMSQDAWLKGVQIQYGSNLLAATAW